MDAIFSLSAVLVELFPLETSVAIIGTFLHAVKSFTAAP